MRLDISYSAPGHHTVKVSGALRSIIHGSHRDCKNWKMGRHFPVREKSGNFVKTGKVMGFYSKYWKIRKNYTGKLKKKPILEKSGKFVSQ